MYVFLLQECNSGTYGKNCIKKCSNYCLHKPCNHIDGVCTDGCQDGYIENMCNTCKNFCKCNFYQYSLTLYLFIETLIYIIFQPANTTVTAKTVHIRVPQIARHAKILMAHAVVLQVGVDQTVAQVLMLLFSCQRTNNDGHVCL